MTGRIRGRLGCGGIGAGPPVLGGALLVAASLLLPTSLAAQVIRSYEGLDRVAGEGFYATVAGAMDVSVGNAEFVDYDFSGTVGYKGPRNWLRLYPGYQYKEAGSEVVTNERSVHLRHSWIFSERTRSFAFVQFQSDEALELDRRFLVGGGLRRRLLTLGDGGLDLGVGLMWEEEVLVTGIRETAVRGANLVAATGTAGAVELTLTGYFQPDIADWADHRVAANGTAAVPLGEAWALTLSARIRRDSRPPDDVARTDGGFTVGLRFAVS